MTPIDLVEVSKQTLAYLVPEILLIVAAVSIMTVGAFVHWPRRVWAALSAGSLMVALGLLALTPDGTPDPYAAVVANDALSNLARLGLLLTGLVMIALAHNQVDDERASDFFGALLMVHAGAMCAVAANELIFLFVGLELISIPTYLLLYLPRRTTITQEAATKYLFLSIFASALLLFGMAYLYGLTGISNLKALAFLVHWNQNALQIPQPTFALVALLFIMAGLAFRVAAVPFHFYAPDVYQGSPTVLAALLAWLPKAVGFVVMLRMLVAVFGWAPVPSEVSNLAHISEKSALLASILAILTMTLGNTVALSQSDLKRLFAYSSIAHAGYLLVGIAAAFRNGAGESQGVLGADSVVFYLATYALMTLGAFGIVLALDSPQRRVETIDDLAGLVRSHPAAALGMAICLFSLAGIPPLAGFWGKFRIFQAALETARGPDAQLFQILTIIGVLNAAIGAYYYLRIIVLMVFKEADEPFAPQMNWPITLAVGACATLSLLIGLAPGTLASASRQAGISVVALPTPAQAEFSPVGAFAADLNEPAH